MDWSADDFTTTPTFFADNASRPVMKRPGRKRCSAFGTIARANALWVSLLPTGERYEIFASIGGPPSAGSMRIWSPMLTRFKSRRYTEKSTQTVERSAITNADFCSDTNSPKVV